MDKLPGLTLSFSAEKGLESKIKMSDYVSLNNSDLCSFQSYATLQHTVYAAF